MKNKKEKISFRETILLYRRNVKILHQYMPGLLLSCTFSSMLKVLTPYVGIYFSARILDELTGGRNMDVLFRLILLTLTITAGLGILQAVVRRWYNRKKDSAFYPDSRRAFIEKMLSMDFAVLDDPHTFDVYSQIQQATNWNGWGLPYLTFQFPRLVESFFKIVGAIALSVNQFVLQVPESGGKLTVLNHPLFTVAFLFLLIGITLLSKKFMALSNSLYATAAENAKMGNRSFMYFGMYFQTERALDVRMYEQAKLVQHYSEKNTIFLPGGYFSKKAKGSIGLFSAAAVAMSKLLIGLVYAFVCLKAWGGAFGVGSVAQYVAALTSFATGLSTLLGTIALLQTNASFLKTAYKLLDIPNDMYQGSLTTEKRADRKYEIEFRDVSFKYPNTDSYALRHLSVKFRVGQKLAVVGLNGSGKTTFIKLLCRLYDPTEGEILLNGIDIRKYNYNDYMSVFAVVFQDFQLLSFSLGQNIAASAEYSAPRAKACLEKVGFGDRLAAMSKGLETCLYKDYDEQGVEVSGGEAQKIAIARALYKDAPFIILDEPTAALDPIAESKIYSNFNDIIGDRTAVYISHRLSSCRFCSRILVFDSGTIVEEGTHEELVSKQAGKYRELWEAQAQYYDEAHSTE